MALFGSKGLFHGLTDTELAVTDADGISMRQALKKLGYNPELVKKPHFQPKDFAAILEFHVAQSSQHLDQLQIIEAIAAPERYKLKIGATKLEPIKQQTQIHF